MKTFYAVSYSQNNVRVLVVYDKMALKSLSKPFKLVSLSNSVIE